MEKKKTQELTQITILDIVQSGDKLLFQIRLPKNAEKITGILVTVEPMNVKILPAVDAPVTPVITAAPINEPVIANTASAKVATEVINPSPVNNTKNLFPLEQIIF